MRRSRSIRSQILLRSLMILSGLLLIIGILQHVYMKDFMYREQAVSLLSQLRSVSPEVWLSYLQKNPNGSEPNPLETLHIPDSTLALIDQTGTIRKEWADPRHGSPPPLSKQTYIDAMQPQRKHGGAPFTITTDALGMPQILVLQPIGSSEQPAGVVQLTASIRSVREVLIRQLTTYVALSALALIGGVLAFLPVLRKTLVPLSSMVQTVESINAGNLNQRLSEQQGQLETDRLAAAFNGMLQRLEDSFAAEKEAKEQMRRFVADASHELRTPLTSIHGFVEVLLRGAAAKPDQLKEALLSMHGESERLTKLVQDLLFLAKVDQAPALAVQPTRGGLHRILGEMEPQLRMLAKSRDVRVTIGTEAELLLDPDRIKQVILNLFQNAVQHTDSVHGRIEVSLTEDAGGVQLTVKDNGPGIPAEALPHLFDRFYRVDTARARTQGGSGLGLSISHSIVEVHGGRLSVESMIGEGSTFTVWLPFPKEGPSTR